MQCRDLVFVQQKNLHLNPQQLRLFSSVTELVTARRMTGKMLHVVPFIILVATVVFSTLIYKYNEGVADMFLCCLLELVSRQPTEQDMTQQ